MHKTSFNNPIMRKIYIFPILRIKNSGAFNISIIYSCIRVCYNFYAYIRQATLTASLYYPLHCDITLMKLPVKIKVLPGSSKSSYLCLCIFNNPKQKEYNNSQCKQSLILTFHK